MNIDNLKKARENIGLTQSQVADRLGISDGTYKNYEQGKREPNNTLLSKIADLYEVSTDYLLGRTTIKRMATEELDPFADIDVSEIEKRIIKQYTELEESTRALCVELFLKLNPSLNAVFQEITQQALKPELPITQAKPQIPPKPVKPPEQVPPPKPDIQISQIRNSKFAIARGGNGMYKPVPTDEQIASFTPVPEDSGL